MNKALVGFSARKSKSKNCICFACHDTTSVIKIRYPQSAYLDGKTLSTMYKTVWLCTDCVSKLLRAIEEVEAET